MGTKSYPGHIPQIEMVVRVALVCMMINMAAANAATKVQRFVQDRFVIGLACDPPNSNDMDDRYAEIAEAHFNLVVGGIGAQKPEAVAKQLQLCEKYGLKAIVSIAGLEPNQLPSGPACWGYIVRDEPGTKDFAGLRTRVDAIRTNKPGYLAYINLFPNYASDKQLGTDNYDEYVKRFIKEVDVDVLSMDHYPLLRPDADGRDGYCKNLEVMRRYSLEQHIPFWNFFNTMPFGQHTDPSEAQIRWQIYTSLAYGAKGVLYFCYWTPKGDEFPKGGAIITAEGRRTRHYYQAQRINAALKKLAPVLMKLTSIAVYRIRPNDDASVVLKGTPIRSLSPGDYLIGIFRHADGRRAVLLNNYRFAYTAWPTVVFDANSATVTEVDQKTGQEVPVIDDSPAIEGLQLSLDSGGGRLFILPQR